MPLGLICLLSIAVTFFPLVTFKCDLSIQIVFGVADECLKKAI